MDEQTQLDWFSDDELEECPRCGERTLVPRVHEELRVCITCGVVDEVEEIGDVAAHARGEEAEQHREPTT